MLRRSLPPPVTAVRAHHVVVSGLSYQRSRRLNTSPLRKITLQLTKNAVDVFFYVDNEEGGSVFLIVPGGASAALETRDLGGKIGVLLRTCPGRQVGEVE